MEASSTSWSCWVAVPAGPDPCWFLCVGPAAVTNLTLTSANSSSLSFSWRPSDGHVDVYDVSLYSVPETAGPGVDAADSRGRHQVGSSFQ